MIEVGKTASLSAVNAKIGKLNSKFLKDEDYINLSHYKTTRDILNYLKENTDVGGELSLYDTTYEAELKMRNYRRAQLEKISHYFSGDYKELSNALMSEFEIEDIKKILRVLQRKNDSQILNYKDLNIDIERFKIDRNSTIQTFIDSLKNTKYYKVLRAYENESDDVILFYMEMNLDKIYYSSLLEATKKFSKADLEVVSKLIGSKIDLLNVTWIYRGLKYYSLLPEELINFCILGGNRLNYNKLKALCYEETVDSLVETILKTEYKFLFDAEKRDIYMDRRASRYLYYTAKRESIRGVSNIGKYLGYTFLLDYEVKDISAILETTRFDIDFEEKLKFLVRSYKGSEL